MDIVYYRDFYQLLLFSCSGPNMQMNGCEFDMRPAGSFGSGIDHSCRIQCQFVPFKGSGLFLPIPDSNGNQTADF